ncbi:MAG TPA: hypothetical protein PK715_10100 [Chitinophagales bacterium]|nr:hypothetical protein [Chitinophagales bacterium]
MLLLIISITINEITMNQRLKICFALLFAALLAVGQVACRKQACKDVVCLNGGSCVEGDCNCPPLYGGENCQTVCPSLTCQNGGQGAIDAANNCYCNCPPGFSGELCQIQNLCYNVQCPANATCNPNTGQCDCNTGYTGPNCDIFICASLPCLNGGQGAVNTAGNCYCDCPAGFSGASCEVQDLCYNVQCPTNAECDPTDGECYCNPGYEGSDCNTQIRSKYFASYNGQDVCPSGTYIYTCTILTSPQGVEYFIIQGFGGFGNAPAAGCPANPFNIVAKVVDSNRFIIEEQTPAACNLSIRSGDASGADNLGLRDANTGIISFTYTVFFTNTNPPFGEVCDAVLTPL